MTCIGIDQNFAEDGTTVISQYVHLKSDTATFDIVQTDTTLFNNYVVDQNYTVNVVTV